MGLMTKAAIIGLLLFVPVQAFAFEEMPTTFEEALTGMKRGPVGVAEFKDRTTTLNGTFTQCKNGMDRFLAAVVWDANQDPTPDQPNMEAILSALAEMDVCQHIWGQSGLFYINLWANRYSKDLP